MGILNYLSLIKCAETLLLVRNNRHSNIGNTDILSLLLLAKRTSKVDIYLTLKSVIMHGKSFQFILDLLILLDMSLK